MANELKMAIVESIFQLRALRWSARRIARHLGIDRGTVRKYLRRADGSSKPAISPTDSASSFSTTSAAFRRAAGRSSWAWIALSIAATALAFALSTSVNTLRYQWTTQRCQAASGKNSPKASTSPRALVRDDQPYAAQPPLF